MNKDDQGDYLSRLLPHRLNALSIAALMLEYEALWNEPQSMEISVNGSLQFDGTTAMFTNPIFEVGVLHARALLEFIGLKVKDRKLVQIPKAQRREGDAGVEMIEGPHGPLRMVTPQEACSVFPSDPTTAREALVHVVLAAHKSVAHSSERYFSDPVDAENIRLALLLTQKLVELHVYAPLGRDRPPVPIEARTRRSVHAAFDVPGKN